jgi:uncharacterized protein (DUF1786 family)
MPIIKIRLQMTEFTKKGLELAPDMEFIRMDEYELPGYVVAVVNDHGIDPKWENKVAVVNYLRYASWEDASSPKYTPVISHVSYTFEPFSTRVSRKVLRKGALAPDGRHYFEEEIRWRD